MVPDNCVIGITDDPPLLSSWMVTKTEAEDIVVVAVAVVASVVVSFSVELIAVVAVVIGFVVVAWQPERLMIRIRNENTNSALFFIFFSCFFGVSSSSMAL